MRRQRKDEEALAALDQAETCDSALPGLAHHRAETLQYLNRFGEAIAIFRQELIRRPGDPGLHLDYNAMLYQLGRKEYLLSSFDTAPKTLVLFPFYMWHGTIPFHDRMTRTTIAFDVVPGA